MKKSWYESSFRRTLADMHIEDWNEKFLSEFSPEDYVKNLKRAKIRSVMLYFQSHNGLCYFPTGSGKMHASYAGREDRMRRLTELCRNEGMDVVGYYSLIYNVWAEDTHPEWRILKTDTESSRELGSRYGLCCPNNPDYLAFVKEQIREISEYFTVDGMFYDMTFWPHFCRCPHCRKKWMEESGQEIPDEKVWDSPDFKRYYLARCRWMAEFARDITDYTRRVMPGVTVEHNYASSVAGSASRCSTEMINDACDYCGGDLYGDLYSHSFAVKYYDRITKHKPAEYMIGRCDPNLQQHTVTKSREALETAAFLNVAHHAATLVIDAVDPVGTTDRRVYERIGDVFEKTIPYEPYLTGGILADAGVIFNTLGRQCGEKTPFAHTLCAQGTSKTLTMRHIPFTVLPMNGLQREKDLETFKVLLLPNTDILVKENEEALVSYVKNGGKLYFSGANRALLRAFFGQGDFEMTASTYTYVAPVSGKEALFAGFNETYPLPFACALPALRACEGTVLAHIKLPYTLPQERRFASIHSNPPGVLTDAPAVVEKSVGKGRVIWSAAPIEADTRGIYREIFTRLVRELLPEEQQTLVTDAPDYTETVTFRDGNSIRIGTVDMTYPNRPEAVRPFDVTLCMKETPLAVKLLPAGEEISFRYENDKVHFTVPSMQEFCMVGIDLSGNTARF